MPGAFNAPTAIERTLSEGLKIVSGAARPAKYARTSLGRFGHGARRSFL
jgi:hypothetical protein